MINKFDECPALRINSHSSAKDEQLTTDTLCVYLHCVPSVGVHAVH